MRYQYILVTIFTIYSLKSYCQTKVNESGMSDSLKMVNEFAKNQIPTISFEELRKITYPKNDSAYLLLFGTPSWCEPCQMAIDTLQKVVKTFTFKKSRIIIVVWPEYTYSIKKTIQYFARSKTPIEKYFCYSDSKTNTFRKMDDIEFFPILLIYKNGAFKASIDGSDFGLSSDFVGKKIAGAVN
jgi:thiol-disulfide isomerase/thioredoxin